MTHTIAAGTAQDALLALFAALKPGETLCFHNNVMRAAVSTEGRLTIEIWDTASTEEIQTAFYALMPGDELLFHEGRYGRIPLLTAGQGNNPSLSGTPDRHITVRGYGNGEARPVFVDNPRDENWIPENTWNMISSYIDISYMEFSDCCKRAIRIKGIHIASERMEAYWSQHPPLCQKRGGFTELIPNEDSRDTLMFVTDVTIRDCVFRNIANVSIALNNQNLEFHRITIENNQFLAMLYTVLYFGAHPGNAPGDRVVIRNNFLDCRKIVDENITGYGMEIKLNVVDSLAERNIVISPKGPGIMTYGSEDADSPPNIVRNNLVVGSRRDASINVGGGPALAEGNLSFGSSLHGITIQNYAQRNLNRAITIRNNTTGFNRSGYADYTCEEHGGDTTTNPEREVVVENNRYYGVSEETEALNRIAAMLERLIEKPESFDAFFDTLEAKPGPYTQEQCAEMLAVLIE